jgi:hypothetical protein
MEKVLSIITWRASSSARISKYFSHMSSPHSPLAWFPSELRAWFTQICEHTKWKKSEPSNALSPAASAHTLHMCAQFCEIKRACSQSVIISRRYSPNAEGGLFSLSAHLKSSKQQPLEKLHSSCALFKPPFHCLPRSLWCLVCVRDLLLLYRCQTLGFPIEDLSLKLKA